MIRIRTGESWKINPAYVRVLREAVGRPRRSLSTAGVLDVLGIEIDGAPLGAPLGEEAILRVVPELVDAVVALCQGAAGSRQVSLSESGVELVLARRDAGHATLCLLSLRRPARILVPEIEVELAPLADAVRACAESLLADLTSIRPELRRTPFARSLRARIRRLAAEPEPPATSASGARTAMTPDAAPRDRGRSAVAVGFDLVDEEGRIDAYRGRHPDLYSLLAPGRVFLRDADGEELLAATQVPFLLLTDLSRVAADLVAAVEAGDPDFTFSLGAASRPATLDLRTGTLIVEGRPVRCVPLSLARAIDEAVVDFAGAIAARNPRQAENAYLTDLAESARERLRLVREIEAGDLVPARAAAVPRRARSSPEPPLSPGTLRRVTYRVVWQTAAPGPLVQLRLCGPVLFAGGADAAVGIDAATGREAWRLEPEANVAFVDDWRALVLAPGAQIALWDCAAGRATWFRRAPGFTQLSARAVRLAAAPGAAADRVAAVVDGRRVWVADALTGRTVWEFAPPQAGRVYLGGGGPLLFVAADSGFAYALDPGTGAPRWRTRLGKPLCGDPLVAGRTALFGAASGREAWILGVDAGSGRPVFARNLDLEEAAVVVPAGRRIVALGLQDRAAAAVALDRGGRILWRTVLPLGRGLPAAAALGSAIVASGRDGSACRLDATGRVVWAIEPSAEESTQAIVPVHRRGVLVLGGSRVRLVEPLGGKLLNALPPAPGLAALESDRSLRLFLGDEDGAVVAYRLASHLSVVG